MALCDECGYTGSLSQFEYIGLAAEIGARTIRKCPECGHTVVCDELEEEKPGQGDRPWGTGDVWGREFKKTD